MTQKELAQRAKTYMDALANGVDPITGRELPEDTVLNRPQMIRCFFYTADILRQVVENGGQVGAKKAGRKRKPSFSLPMERRAAVPFSPDPLQISKFVERLNGMVDLNEMKRLPATAVTAWMTEKGFLQLVETPDGRRSKRPTPQGEQIGLSTEDRQGVNGPYTVILYNNSAQHFIVDNLDDILQAYEK